MKIDVSFSRMDKSTIRLDDLSQKTKRNSPLLATAVLRYLKNLMACSLLFKGKAFDFSSDEVVVGLGVFLGGHEGEFVGHVCGGGFVFGQDLVGVNEKGVGVTSSHHVGSALAVKIKKIGNI